jgi:phosphoribosyl 1,2-cyclic phosphodiesterase
MIAVSLQSGSSGNCIYVETGDIKLLFDAGISGVAAERRLRECGRDIRDVTALIISHDHSDHVRYAGVYERKFGIPVYITPRTLQAAEKNVPVGRMRNVHAFFPGSALNFGRVTVRTLPTPHDGVDGSVFVVCSGTKRLGIMTDLGHVFQGLKDEIASLDAVFIESNFDAVMLRNGPYPSFLKHRVEGPCGHLSNIEAAELLLEGKRLKWACLSHLSGNNNDPAVAVQTHRDVIGNKLKLYTASRSRVSDILKV